RSRARAGSPSPSIRSCPLLRARLRRDPRLASVPCRYLEAFWICLRRMCPESASLPVRYAARQPGPGVCVCMSGRRQRPQHLHHEHGLVRSFLQTLERCAQLPSQCLHDLLVRSEHLRAQAVRHHLQARVIVQARDERADRRNEVAAQRIQADHDPDVHACRLPRPWPQYCTHCLKAAAAMIAPGARIACQGGDGGGGTMTRKIQVHQVDAFTREPFTGNPTGVVLNADALTEAQMLAIARELNNAETA